MEFRSLRLRLRRRALLKIVVVALLAALLLTACGGRSLLSTSKPTAQVVAVATGTQFAPSLTLDPPSGYAGLYVQATGAGWPPNMMVIVILTDPSDISMTVATKDTDGEGKLTTGFLYPIDTRWVLPGLYTIAAESADGHYQATAKFTVVQPGTEISSTVPATTTQVAASASASATATTTTPTATPVPTVKPTAANSPTPQATSVKAASAGGNQPPVVTAALVPTEDRPGPHQQFRVEFTATDPDDNLSDVVAILQLPAFASTDTFKLDVKDKVEISINPGRIEISAPDPQALLDSIRQQGGIEVENGQLIEYMPSPEQIVKVELNDDKLNVQAATLILQVTATDAAGLSQQVTLSPPDLSGNQSENDDDKGHKHDKKDDKGHGNNGSQGDDNQGGEQDEGD